MALNKNHEFEELDGVRCGIVERKVITVPTPPPKVAAVAPPKEGEETVLPPPPVATETFTVGVTDYTFNSINAIFGRMLKTQNGHIVTQAYWNQKESESHDEIPYYEN